MSCSMTINKHTRLVGCMSSNDQQVMLLKSLLSIVGNRQESQSVWVYAEDDHMDAVVVDLDDEGNATVGEDKDGAIVIFMSRDPARISQHKFPLPKPLRSKELLHLLDSLDEHLGNGSTLPQPVSSRATKAQASMNPLDVIASALADSHAKFLHAEFDGAPINIDTVRKRVYLGAGFSYAKATACQRFICTETKDLIADGPGCVSLADFVYEYTFSTRDAVLLTGLDKDSRFYIRQWPQFMNSANTRALVKLSAYFSRRRTTLQSATKELLVGMNQLVAYINAAHAQGLLMVEADLAVPANGVASVPAEPASVAASKGSFGGLFGKIRQKLGL